MEMNVPVAIVCVIGMIGFISWGIVKNFEDKMRVNPTMAGDGLVGIEAQETEDEDEDEAEAEAEEAEAEAEEAEAEAEEVNEPNFASTNVIDSDEVLDAEMDIEEEKQTQVQTIQADIDAFHERIEEIDNKLEVTRNLVTELCQTVIDTNNSTKNHFNGLLDSLTTKMNTSINDILNSITNLCRRDSVTTEALSSIKDSLGDVNELKTQATTLSRLETSTTDSIASIKNSLGEFARIRDLTELKTQMDELVKRSAIQKTVYQAWNGSAKWTDFNEGGLNIQMIRKKFMTAEQNEDWLLPENKKIAAYNRDQLLGLTEDTWISTDNTVFVKRYYKDDWDSSIEVAITVTLSKKILVPPGGKPETIITHILKRLYEKEQIEWEHLLVNV